MKSGKLIIFEGISGTGKETQATLLQKYLEKQNIRSHIIFHPSPELKPILSLWRKERQIDSRTEAYLLLADRRSRVNQLINPILTKGEWVIGLRNYISALVYQGKSEADRKWLKKEFFTFEPVPDYIYYFDITPDVALDRILGRHGKTGEMIGRFETQSLLQEKRQNYKNVLRNIPHILIDAGGTVKQVHKQIVRHI